MRCLPCIPLMLGLQCKTYIVLFSCAVFLAHLCNQCMYGTKHKHWDVVKFESPTPHSFHSAKHAPLLLGPALSSRLLGPGGQLLQPGHGGPGVPPRGGLYSELLLLPVSRAAAQRVPSPHPRRGGGRPRVSHILLLLLITSSCYILRFKCWVFSLIFLSGGQITQI